MELRWNIKWLIFASSMVLTIAIPASLIDEIKASELKASKVKRAHPLNNPEHIIHDNNPPQYYNKPTAIKRGTNLKNPIEQSNEWNDGMEQQQANYPSLNNIQSTLYNSDDSSFDDKSLAEYEKGFHYGTNKEKLDEALENAVLKSELYGEPTSINQYRYYGRDDRRRRKRREIQQKLRMENRIKRDVDLTPEEILTILTLYENEQRQNGGYKPIQSNWQQRYEPQDDDEEDEENWLDNPVYPHSTNDIGPNYIYEDNKYDSMKRNGYWGNYADNRKKRFMIAKKRQIDPTRELRYLNGPNQNDFYTLSQLLSNQREPNVPLYHRLVL